MNITDAADIVHADIVEFRQKNQTVDRDSGFSKFVIAIGALSDLKKRSDFCLCAIVIFSQGTDAFCIVHNYHLTYTIS